MRIRAPRPAPVALVLLAAAVVTWAAPASAAPPANDAFAAAQPLAGESGTVAGTNVDASKEAGEPDHADDDGGRSVWYRWTAPATGSYIFDTCGTGFDTLLAVYTGTAVSALTEIAADDDTCGEQSLVVFAATAGTLYSIAVDGFDDDPPTTGPFTLRWRRALPPANDDFADAQQLAGAAGAVDGTNVGAEPEPGERSVAGSTGRSIWFRWTSPFTGTASFETCGSTFDTVLAALTGTSVSALTVVASNDDRCALASRIRFVARAGTEYKLLVDGTGDLATGFFRLAWSLVARPANDSFRTPRPIGGARGSLRSSNEGALSEATEPAHAGYPPAASVWFRWRAPRTMPIQFQTCQPGFDTILAVYRGTRPRASTRVDADDDSCPGDTGSRLAFRARGGAVYLIVVDGVFDARGAFVLAWGRPSPGAQACRVPDVRGLTVSQAGRALERADCQIGRIVYSRSALVPRGRVISQSPRAGRRLPFLARVNLEVSR